MMEVKGFLIFLTGYQIFFFNNTILTNFSDYSWFQLKFWISGVIDDWFLLTHFMLLLIEIFIIIF
jgi:hypothetical protein